MSGINCPHCGQKHPGSLDLCPDTGRHIPKQSLCPHCRQKIEGHWRVCGHCGKSLVVGRSGALNKNLVYYILAIAVIAFATGVLILISNLTQAPKKTSQVARMTSSQEVNADETPTSSQGLAKVSVRTPTISIYSTKVVIPKGRVNKPVSTSTPARAKSPTPESKSGEWDPCEAVYESRLHVGDQAYVSYYPPLANWVRTMPGKSSGEIGKTQPGEEVNILDGPACANSWVWWKIRSLETGVTGWTSEGDSENYWLIPSQ